MPMASRLTRARLRVTSALLFLLFVCLASCCFVLTTPHPFISLVLDPLPTL